MKYQELRSQDNIAIAYNEGANGTDEFEEIQIIKLENEQKLQYAYVPVELIPLLEAEKATARTTQYHDWTAEFTPVFESIVEAESDEEAKQLFEEEIKEYIEEAKEAYTAIIGGTYAIESIEEVNDYNCRAIINWNLQK